MCAVITSCIAMHGTALPQDKMLEEVVVTAQKRTQNMQDVPVAVSVMGANDMADAGISDVADLAQQMPSLIVTTNVGPMFTSFRLRRIGNESNIPAFEPATALFIDEAFRPKSGVGLGDLVDVTNIEVMKGPQSTLFGKNATAGVISVKTKMPSDVFEAKLIAEHGSDDLRQYKGTITGPVTKRMSGRLSYVRTTRDHLMKNLSGRDAHNLDQETVRAQLHFSPNDKWNARLIAGYADKNMNVLAGDVRFSPASLRVIERAGGRITNNDPEDRIIEYWAPLELKMDATDLIAHIDYDGQNIGFKSISSYDTYHAPEPFPASQTPLRILMFQEGQEQETLSQEFRFSSTVNGSFDWMLGTYFYKSDYVRGESANQGPAFEALEDIEEFGDSVLQELAGSPTLQPNPAPYPLLGVEGDKGYFKTILATHSYGIYTHNNWAVTPRVEVSFGLRHSIEEKQGSFKSWNELSPLGCVPPLNSNFICLLTPDGKHYEAEDTWRKTTGSGSVTYFLSDSTMLYAQYSTGFKAGGFNLGWGTTPDELRPYNEENVVNREVGWKTELFERRLRFNGALFSTVYEDLQSATFVGLQFVVDNAEKALVEGLEIDTSFILTPSLSADVSLSYIEAEYEEFTQGPCHYGREPGDPFLNRCDLSDETLPFAPELTGKVTLKWTFPLFNGDLYARTDYSHTGRQNVSTGLDPRFKHKPYGILNARIGWRNSLIDTSIWVKNATDETVIQQTSEASIMAAIDNAVGSPVGSFQNYLRDPRSIGATLRSYF